MDREPLVRLMWHGYETIEVIPELLNQAEKIEIQLPADYNHALFRALHPDSPAAEVEDIDISGGPELLNDIATVSGLEAFSVLIQELTAVHASVRILSPPKLVISIPEHTGRKIDA